ncbi:MAG: hypothetical protein ACFFGZ_16745 [Candidatus Thorarchaeota archaeon]
MPRQNGLRRGLPSSLKTLKLVTSGLAGLGLLLGLFLLAITWDLPLHEEPPPEDEDPLPDFGYFFRFLGIIFTVFAVIGLVGSLLIDRKRVIGWLSLVGVYGSGFAGCLYILFRVFLLIVESNSSLLFLGLASSPIPYLMIWGGCALVILFHKNTLDYVFRKQGALAEGA